MFNSKKAKKQSSVGKHFTLGDQDQKQLLISIKKIVGQLEAISRDIESNNACDETLTQIMAIKGGVESLGRNIVGKGVLDCLGQYSREELEIIVKNLFKIS